MLTKKPSSFQIQFASSMKVEDESRNEEQTDRYEMLGKRSDLPVEQEVEEEDDFAVPTKQNLFNPSRMISMMMTTTKKWWSLQWRRK